MYEDRNTSASLQEMLHCFKILLFTCMLATFHVLSLMLNLEVVRQHICLCKPAQEASQVKEGMQNCNMSACLPFLSAEMWT